jgi:hypothetical protein
LLWIASIYGVGTDPIERGNKLKKKIESTGNLSEDDDIAHLIPGTMVGVEELPSSFEARQHGGKR